MADMGVTETTATAVAAISSLVQETLKQKSLILPLISDYSSFAKKGDKSVGIPRRDQFAAADKSENSALTSQALTFAADTISLAKHKAIYAKLEDIAGLQASPDVAAEIIKEMAAELALQVDKDLYTELKLASAAAPDHRVAFANTTTLGKSDIINARKLLNIQSVPMEDRWLLINPLHESELLSIADFVDVSQYGSPNAVMNGELGRLFGFRVVMSNVVADANCVAFHKSAVGFASQWMPNFETDRDLANVATEYLMNWIYGSKVLDSGKRQVLIGTAA